MMAKYYSNLEEKIAGEEIFGVNNNYLNSNNNMNNTMNNNNIMNSNSNIVQNNRTNTSNT